METIIGLEVHIPIKTEEKLFCNCKTNYYNIQNPNWNICPVCTGMPGSKPNPINEEGLKAVIMIAKMLNCKISERIFIKRKHYAYPDLPSGYQRTSEPIGIDGKLNDVRIWEVHIEEDPGKYDLNYKRVDYNRSGTVLAEIVTAPDLHSPKEARDFLKDLINLAKYSNKILDVGGIIRVDINISIEGGARVEIKNINSLKGITKALTYEITRQKNLIERNKVVVRETRGFDENQMITIPLRTKETEADYRYIPDPDIPPLNLKEIEKDIIIPETPQSRKKRIIEETNIKENFAEILVRNKELADVFENIVNKSKELSNIASIWLCTEVIKQLNYRDIEWTDAKNKLNEKILTELFLLLKDKKITENVGKKILERIIDTGESPIEIVNKENLLIEINEDFIENIVKEVIKENEKAVNDYKSGKKEAINFLIGQIIRKTKGKVDNNKVREILIKNLNA